MKKLILIGGRARTGKDTLARLIKKELLEMGYKSDIFSFAHALKQEAAQYVRENYNLDVFSDVTSEKDIFRPYLVELGCRRREESNGLHWVNIVKNEIYKSTADYIIIPDVRFVKGEFDLLREFEGRSVYLSAYNYRDGESTEVECANETEVMNDAEIKEAAEYHIHWRIKTTLINTPLDVWCAPWCKNLISSFQKDGFINEQKKQA